MARFRLSELAQADLALILSASAERWGEEGQQRYRAILGAAMRKAAGDPHGPTTRDRDELLPGVRSIHIRHARGDHPQGKVRAPVHVLYFRVLHSELIEIVRVLHERMEPGRYIGEGSDDWDR